MRHLIICREYPPAPSGGIGTYVFHLSRLLAEAGETVHVIGQMWRGGEAAVEERCGGRLIIHRVPFEDWTSFLPHRPHPALAREARMLFDSSFAAQAFSWGASLLAERLAEQEGIDLIEAQEYEAPLYFFQLRRALGMGPERQPPCLVHLHSPTVFIARHNDWDISQPHISTAKRLEDYSILAADALLCPSRYVARQVEAHYGLPHDGVHVIPLPIGDNPVLERERDIWERGTILYSGRLERRKGVIEWIEAAVSVAADYPAARFEFVGSNVLGTDKISSEEFLDRLVPGRLKGRFIFHGEQERASLPKFLSRARMAVVPSRWENFPNSCVEAMCSGLPVIATREGGMVEMIEEGRTGWLAQQADSAGLAEALRRALETPPGVLAEMGRRSSESIHEMCDNAKILESHLKLRSQIVKQGARTSLSLPSNLPWEASRVPDKAKRHAARPDLQGLAVVVTGGEGRQLDRLLSSLDRQKRMPAAVVIVGNEDSAGKALAALNSSGRQGWQIIPGAASMSAARNAGVEAALASNDNLLGFVFLSEGDRLHPDFLFECERALRRCPEAGLISCWIASPEAKGRAVIKPCPSFPYQWAANEAAPFSAVRTEALLEAGGFRAVMEDGYESWDLFNAVMASGWVAVTLPLVLGESSDLGPSLRRSAYNHVPGRMRKSLVDRFPDLIARDAPDVILLVESHAAHSLEGDRATLSDQFGQAATMLRNPLRTARMVLARLRKVMRALLTGFSA